MAFGRHDVCGHGSLRRKCAICEGDARIAQLEERLRVWRDDYQRSADGSLVTIPVHQIIALIGEKPERN